MTPKELKRLSRTELLEMLLQQVEENEALRSELEEANNKLMESYRSEDAQQHDTIEAHERDLVSPGGITEIEEQVASEARMRELEAFLGEQSCRIIQLIADGYKYKECAEILQVPIGTICGMVHRIREEMKKPENAEKIKKILG